jgi:methylphosphotriester-DNA--protein-cysteine methyltransferase
MGTRDVYRQSTQLRSCKRCAILSVVDDIHVDEQEVSELCQVVGQAAKAHDTYKKLQTCMRRTREALVRECKIRMNMIPTPSPPTCTRSMPATTRTSMREDVQVASNASSSTKTLRTSSNDISMLFSGCGRRAGKLRSIYIRLDMSNPQATMCEHTSPSVTPTLFCSSMCVSDVP